MRIDEPQRTNVIDWIVASLVLFLLATLVLPAVAQTRDDSRASACLDHCKLLAAGLLGHKDAKKFFPAASTAPFDGHPCNDNDDGDVEYSWQTLILPFLDETTLYSTISDQSDKFNRPPLAVRLPKYAGDKLAAAVQLEQLRCPAFSGSPFVDVKASDYKSLGDDGAPALTNYFALSASHLVDKNGLWRLANTLPIGPASQSPAASSVAPALNGNGVLPFFSREALEKVGARKWRGMSGVSEA